MDPAADQTYPTLIFSLLDNAKSVNVVEKMRAEWRKKSRKSSVHPTDTA